MTDIDVYRPAAEITAPADRDIDSWIGVVKEVVNLAKLIYDTEFVPKGLRGSMPATAAAILSGREMGLGPMTSLQHIHVIGGKPGQSALLMRALIEAQGHKWEDVDISDTRVILRGRRKDQSAWTEVTFTADQARKAGIQLGGYPQDKLYARASVRLARRRFADVIVGMPYAIEELEDGDALEGTVAEDGPAAIKPAQNGKSRTAQRKPRTPDASPAPPQPPVSPPAAATTPATPVSAESAGEALPPLPGEEDSAPAAQGDGHAAGAAPDDTDRHARLVGVVQGHLKRLSYTVDDNDRDERLHDLARLAEVSYDASQLTSTNDFDEDELSRIARSLQQLPNGQRGHAKLKALLEAQEEAH